MLVDKASQAGWMNSTYQRLTSASLAVLAFALAEMFHGNGFIAAFFGGLMLGTHTPIVRKRIQEFGEAEGQQLQLFIFLLLGLMLVPTAARYWDSRAWLYALLSLSVIRMLPVAIGLAGTSLAWPSIAFIGWFGPRGIASILYLIMALIEIGVAGLEQMMSIIVLTILLSVFLHGITAVPLSRLYAGQVTNSRG
jgi:sodium/hydrogen antiporter